MGCCVSTDVSAPPQLAAAALVRVKTTERESRESPPSMEEEEKVKEVVLSETPALLESETRPLKPQELHSCDNGQDSIDPREPLPAVATPSFVPEQPRSALEVPEPRSRSGRVAVADSAPRRRAESDRPTVKPQPTVKPEPSRTRSLSSESSVVTGRVAGTSPTRIRADPSPSRRHSGSVRLVQSKLDIKRDPGESSGRRQYGGVGGRSLSERSPSMRKTSLSPGRVRRDPNGSSKRLDGSDKLFKQKRPNGKDSLESPSVSLECFIFL